MPWLLSFDVSSKQRAHFPPLLATRAAAADTQAGRNGAAQRHGAVLHALVRLPSHPHAASCMST